MKLADINREKIRKYQEGYYQENREKILEYRKKYRQENPEKIQKCQKEYWQENGEKLKASRMEWRKENPERHMAQVNKWRRNNPEKWRASRSAGKQKRRARLKLVRNDLTMTQILSQYAEQDGKCFYCGIYVGTDYHTDHVIPISKGGENTKENIVIACPECNLMKGVKTVSEFMEYFELVTE